MPPAEDAEQTAQSEEGFAQTARDSSDRVMCDGSQNEAAIRREIPVFINSFNQLRYLRDTIDWFAGNGFGNVTVLDNASSLPPLLQYLRSEECLGKARVVHLGENIGPRRSLERAAENPTTDKGFIFTDPDLTLPNPVAPDFLTSMFAAGVRYGCPKVGLGLSLDPDIIDLDRTWYRGRTVGEWESRFWRKEIEPGIYKAPVDTTFFLYVPQSAGPRRFNDLGPKQSKIPAIRIGAEGYTAIHRPWLLQDDLPEDEIGHYLNSATAHSTQVRSQQQIASDRAKPAEPDSA